MRTLTDAEFISLLRDPLTREKAFRQLVQQYQQKIYWHVRRMVLVHDDADDVVQNIFIKVYQNLASFRQDSGLYTWIYRITVNETITFLKNRRKHRYLPFNSHDAGLADCLAESQGFTGNEIQRKLQQAILKLPEKQRLVFNMKYFDDQMTFEALSAILGTSTGALKASYHLAVKKIEKSIRGD